MDFFSIGFHGMMDAYSLDTERARRCCVHRLSPDGRLVPFCLYNAKYRATDRRAVSSRGLFPAGPAGKTWDESKDSGR